MAIQRELMYCGAEDDHQPHQWTMENEDLTRSRVNCDGIAIKCRWPICPEFGVSGDPDCEAWHCNPEWVQRDVVKALNELQTIKRSGLLAEALGYLWVHSARKKEIEQFCYDHGINFSVD